MLFGIDRLSFYTSRYFLDLRLLAEKRGVDADKFFQGLGQQLMSMPPPDEDVVTLAATSASLALKGIDPESISMVLIATESGVDQSKACGIWVHHLLGLPSRCRIIELKQACYSGCAALQLGLSHIRQHPDKKVLVLATDIARYGLNSPGEPTQGCGAAALVLSANPRLVAIDPEYGSYTSHVMDFWRPNYCQEAIVDGKYSTKIYLEALSESWKDYTEQSKRHFTDHHRFCYHIPFTRMAQKAHERLAKLCDIKEINPNHVEESLIYGRQLGNSYTASLFIGLASLLDNSQENLSNKRIGFFSYGSGCVAEYFSGTVQPGYERFLSKDEHRKLLAERQPLSWREYEDFYRFSLPTDGSQLLTKHHQTGAFRLEGIDEHKRLYART